MSGPNQLAPRFHPIGGQLPHGSIGAGPITASNATYRQRPSGLPTRVPCFSRPRASTRAFPSPLPPRQSFRDPSECLRNPLSDFCSAGSRSPPPGCAVCGCATDRLPRTTLPQPRSHVHRASTSAPPQSAHQVFPARRWMLEDRDVVDA